MLLLSPTEYSGDPTTCVCGRVVIRRGPFDINRREDGRASGKKGNPGHCGKGKGGKRAEGPLRKMEFHLQGGATGATVLYVDAWGAAAEEVARTMSEGVVYRISGGKVINQSPQYSTSRLSYFLRVVAPVGVNTVIQEVTVSPWNALPLHHPFVDLASLGKVQGSLQLCMLGIITLQPGVVERDTPYGRSGVCNAVIKRGSHDIRCAFWRENGENLARFGVGREVALLQVTVKKVSDGSWEVGASDATQVIPCPADLVESLRRETDTSDTAAPATSLTRRQTVDYDTAPAQTSTVSGLFSVIVPQVMRELPGIFDLHNVAVMGVSSVTFDGAWQIRSCSECKKKVSDDNVACPSHPTAGFEYRWLLSLEIADETGRGHAVMYHDAACALDVFGPSGGPPDLEKQRKMGLAIRAVPWTLRLVFRPNELTQTNVLEVKRMLPTLAPEGVVGNWAPAATGAVTTTTSCPFSVCADVTFDQSLGITLVKDREVSAVRVLLRTQKIKQDEIVALPDADNLGFRVQRYVRCGLNDAKEETYLLKTAGVPADVQWLMTAAPDDVFLVTAMVQEGAESDRPEFNVLAHMSVTPNILPSLVKLMLATVNESQIVNVTHVPAATPTKRLQQVLATAGEPSTPQPLSRRRRLA